MSEQVKVNDKEELNEVVSNAQGDCVEDGLADEQMENVSGGREARHGSADRKDEVLRGRYEMRPL